MRTNLSIGLLFGVALIALGACGGGSDNESQLRMDLEAAQEAAEEAEEARKKAEEEAAEAERKRLAEEAAREEAEAEAERQRLAAVAAAEAEAEAERLRQEAEAERQRLADEAEAAQRVIDTERARVAISGARTLGTAPVVGTIRHGAPAPVTDPVGPFTTTTGSSGGWSTTTHTATREATRHTIEIYDNVEAPTRSAFRTSALNTEDVGPTGTTTVVDGTGDVIGWVEIMNASGGDDNHSRIAAAGSFPREIGNPKPFSLVDRGLTQSDYSGLGLAADGSATDSDLDTAGITRQQYNQYRADRGFRDTDDFPQRYAYTTSGQLQGASGTYRCNGASDAATCTVQNRGGSFEFGGDWDFIPSSGTVQIVVPDGQYMWFGWWAQQTVEHQDPAHPTNIWAFQANHGGTNAVTDLSAATGSATYKGPAAGHYAIYEPDTGDSSIGSFTASATLQADFDASPSNTVSGTITGFSNDSGWSLALKPGIVTGGTVARAEADDVTWTIDGVPDDSGEWEAGFYSNLPPGGVITYQPHGIAGTFEATYDPSGVGARAAVIGGFGAHR